MNFLQKYTIPLRFVRSRLDAIRPRCDFLSKSPLPYCWIQILYSILLAYAHWLTSMFIVLPPPSPSLCRRETSSHLRLRRRDGSVDQCDHRHRFVICESTTLLNVMHNFLYIRMLKQSLRGSSSLSPTTLLLPMEAAWSFLRKDRHGLGVWGGRLQMPSGLPSFPLLSFPYCHGEIHISERIASHDNIISSSFYCSYRNKI